MVKKKLNTVEQIYKSSTKLLELLYGKEIYSTIVKEAIKLVGADHGSIVILENGDLNRVYSTYKPLNRIKPKKSGLPYKAFNDKVSMIVSGSDIDKMNPKFRQIGIGSILFIPLFYRNKSVGALNVYYFSDRTFTNEQLNVLELFGSLASLAILQKGLYHQSKMIAKREKILKNLGNILQKIHRASLQFLIPISAEDTYKVIVRELIKLARGEFGSLILEQNNQLVRVYTTLPIASQVKIRKDGFTYRAFRTRKTLVQDEKEVERAHPEMKKYGIRSNIFIPLSNQGRSIGVLIVNFLSSNPFDEDDLNTLKLFGSMASLAIRKSQLYDEIKGALESRDLFISMAAHELRTPTTTINGYAQLLKQKLMAKNLPEFRWAEELSWEGIRLSLLINDLLDVSRIKGGRMQFNWKECSLSEIMDRSLKSFKFVHPERVLIVDNKIPDGQDKIIADLDKILQVLINILDNAAKFSPSDSQVNLSAEFKKPYFIITVKDHGKGIAKEDMSRVFEGFYRSKGEQKEGMGLGLFLAKNIIEAHRGDIEISSKVGKGTTVEIKLTKSRL